MVEHAGKSQKEEIKLTPDEVKLLDVIKKHRASEDAVSTTGLRRVIAKAGVNSDENLFRTYTAIDRLRIKYPGNIATVIHGHKTGSIWWYERK